MSSNQAAQVSILRLMILVAIVAASLALLLEIPYGARVIPTFWIVLGVLDFVAIRKLVLRWPLRAWHHVFLIVFVVLSMVLMTQVAMERIHPLGFLIRCCQELTGHPAITAQIRGFLDIGEFWMAVEIAFLIAWACGAIASRLERRRGWDIAAACRGGLIGFAIACLFGVAQHAALGPERESLVANWLALGLGVLLFGWFGRTRLRSAEFAPQATADPVIPPSAATGPQATGS